jgi:hypothetical protein
MSQSMRIPSPSRSQMAALSPPTVLSKQGSALDAFDLAHIHLTNCVISPAVKPRLTGIVFFAYLKA